jgi:hypothetical protein
MVLNMKVNTYRAKSTVKENSPGLMDLPITVCSSKITSKDQANIIGPMVESTMDSGITTKWRAKELSHGLMEEGTRATM